MMSATKLTCNTCDIDFDRLGDYQLHMHSISHAQAVLGQKPIFPNLVALPKATSIPTANSKDYTVDSNMVFTCHVCDIFVTGHVPFEAHIAGQKHQKKLKQKNYLKSIDQLKNMTLEDSEESIITGRGDASNYAINKKTISVKTTLVTSCENNTTSSVYSESEEKAATCFDAEKPTLIQLPIMYVNKSSYLSLSQPFSCEPCSKSFTGIEPYQQHMSSPVHFKKLNRLPAALEPQVYYCDICRVNSSGPIPYKQHMTSEKHMKQVIAQSTYPNVQYHPPVSQGSTTAPSVLSESGRQEFWNLLEKEAAKVQGTKKVTSLTIVESTEPFKLEKNTKDELSGNESKDELSGNDESKDELSGNDESKDELSGNEAEDEGKGQAECESAKGDEVEMTSVE